MLDNAVPRTLQDEVVVFVNGVGLDEHGVRRQVNFRRIVKATKMFGRVWPAIELTTAAGVCAMVDMHAKGRLPAKGFIRQEQCSLDEFNRSLFGLAYENPDAIEAAAVK
jgi:saccharopine dehydrogenase-like NADP-dependent oxidoreductase